MSQKRRTQVIQEFQSSAADSPAIMLLSLKAGGVGLNLTAASHVFLMDPVSTDSAQEPDTFTLITTAYFIFLVVRAAGILFSGKKELWTASSLAVNCVCVLGMESCYWGAVYRPLPPSGTEEESRCHQGRKLGLYMCLYCLRRVCSKSWEHFLSVARYHRFYTVHFTLWRLFFMLSPRQIPVQTPAEMISSDLKWFLLCIYYISGLG